jgi:2-polyprenyl-3-methyl-5-hydroxy-6-metoxy-1,4-benzoquinol methylase
MIVEDQLDRDVSRIGGIEKLEELDKFAAAMAILMRATYDRIMSLPPEASDNMGRVARVLAFAERHPPVRRRQPRLLDVGSGLAVFPERMREAGWDCTALDPDPRAAEHAQSLGLATATGDFLTMDLAALDQFDFVTFNKVIEHVEAPVVMLHRTSGVLDPGGLVSRCRTAMQLPPKVQAARSSSSSTIMCSARPHWL